MAQEIGAIDSYAEISRAESWTLSPGLRADQFLELNCRIARADEAVSGVAPC
ncbi:hypothetical protein [Leptospira perolatii]|uniref:hypothetical protein n=1 Tax=Leptospira perolatii TaxID=2023191 RepID=UPI0013FDF15A|nr:hypothetical protein [Leptospira perolatii]